MKCFTENLGKCSAHLKKLQNKENSEKCEIIGHPSVLLSPTVQRSGAQTAPSEYFGEMLPDLEPIKQP